MQKIHDKEIIVRVYADRSVEMVVRYLDDGTETRRQDYLQTRDEAAWILSFSRDSGKDIERTWL